MEEQEGIKGEGFVLIVAELHDADSLSQAIVLVPRKHPQLLILCGLEEQKKQTIIPYTSD